MMAEVKKGKPDISEPDAYFGIDVRDELDHDGNPKRITSDEASIALARAYDRLILRRFNIIAGVFGEGASIGLTAGLIPVSQLAVSTGDSHLAIGGALIASSGIMGMLLSRVRQNHQDLQFLQTIATLYDFDRDKSGESRKAVFDALHRKGIAVDVERGLTAHELRDTLNLLREYRFNLSDFNLKDLIEHFREEINEAPHRLPDVAEETVKAVGNAAISPFYRKRMKANSSTFDTWLYRALVGTTALEGYFLTVHGQGVVHNALTVASHYSSPENFPAVLWTTMAVNIGSMAFLAAVLPMHNMTREVNRDTRVLANNPTPLKDFRAFSKTAYSDTTLLLSQSFSRENVANTIIQTGQKTATCIAEPLRAAVSIPFNSSAMIAARYHLRQFRNSMKRPGPPPRANDNPELGL